MKTNKVIFSAFLALCSLVVASTEARADGTVPNAATVEEGVDKAVASKSDTVDPEAPKKGFSFRAELPIVIPQGSLFKGEDAFGPGAGFGGYVGYYIVPNVALFAGAQGSFGHSQSGCNGCKGSMFEVPIFIEVAQNKVSGFYGTAGLSLLPTAALSDATGAQVTIQGVADAKLGFGYRMSQRQLANNKNPSMFSFSFFTAATMGQYSQVSATDGSGNAASGNIDSGKQEFHYTLTAGVGVAFLP